MHSNGSTTLKYRLATALVAVVAAFGIVACGGGDDGGGSAEDVVKDFATALADEDGKKACDQLADSAKQEFEQSGQKCEDILKLAFGQLSDEDKDKLKDIDPDVQEDGDKATAKVDEIDGEGSSEIKLEKQDGDWKITDLGS